MKRCTKCNREYPATLEFFYKNGRWLRGHCRKCQNRLSVIYTTNWRKRTKLRIIAMMGGSCGSCGYNKCSAALDLHHKGNKEYLISYMIKKHMAWQKILKEAKKCRLLCKNCHTEFHSGKNDLAMAPDGTAILS